MAIQRPSPDEVVRMPLISPYNTRNLDASSTTVQATAIIGLGVVGTFTVGSTGVGIKDKRLINCFSEKVNDPLAGAPKYYITKRPGFAALNTPAAGELASAIKVWATSNDEVITAFGSTNSTIYSDITSLGAITGVATFIEETILAGTPYLAITSSDNTAWYSDGGAPAEITDGDFPGKAGRTITGKFVFLDGFAFIIDTSGRIYNSDENSLTAWTSASYIPANMYPDKAIGLSRYKNLIVAFGKETVEFFYNNGNEVGSPLDRYPQGFIHFGCLNQYSYTQLEDTIAWVSSSDRSGIGVYVLDGVSPKRISTPFIDTQLSIVNTNSVFVTSAKLVGKTFIVITTSSTTFVYDMEDDSWHEWYGSKVLWNHLAGTTSGTRLIYGVSRSDTGGKVFIINPSNLVYADDGDAYTMVIQTTKFDKNTINWKFLHKLTVIADSSTSANDMTIQWSDDDYVTWSSGRTVDLNNDEPYIMNCGKFRRRAFKLSNSVDNPVRLEALELQFKSGIH